MKLYSEESIQNIANAIRSKNGESTQYKVGEMAQAILDIPSGGGVSEQTYINLMASQDFPSGDIVITEKTSLSASAFRYRTNITKVYSESLTSLNWSQYAFDACTNLEEINFPNVTTGTGGGYQLADTNGATKCKTIKVPKLEDAATFFFYNRQGLTTVDVKALKALPQSCFQQCYSLEILDLPSVKSIASTALYNCRKLSTIILRSTTMVVLANANVLNNTPFAGYGGLSGTLYVPQALVSTYENSSNWATILAKGFMTISPIEGSIYETQYADGTPIE